jgi:hypothetical protein
MTDSGDAIWDRIAGATPTWETGNEGSNGFGGIAPHWSQLGLPATIEKLI